MKRKTLLIGVLVLLLAAAGLGVTALRQSKRVGQAEAVSSETAPAAQNAVVPDGQEISGTKAEVETKTETEAKQEIKTEPAGEVRSKAASAGAGEEKPSVAKAGAGEKMAAGTKTAAGGNLAAGPRPEKTAEPETTRSNDHFDATHRERGP